MENLCKLLTSVWKGWNVIHERHNMCYGKVNEKVFEYRHYGVGDVKVLITNIAFGDDFNKYLNRHHFMPV